MQVAGTVESQFSPSNMSAFGTLEASELTPVIQGDWVYGINTQIWNTPVVSGTGAAVDSNLSRLRIQSGTGAANYAYITSKKIVRYRAGQGIVIRLTPLFSVGAANSVQMWGAGAIAAHAPQDGYFFGYNGTALGIFHYNHGSPTWIPQSSWNGDKVDGSAGTAFNWNPTFGTPAMIKYPYLGYGDIEFFLQNPATGRWVLVHVIQYANTTPLVQLGNPSLQIVGYTANSGNTTNLTMYSGSVGAFISGMRSFAGNPKWAADSSNNAPGAPLIVKGLIQGSETCMLNLRNCTTYNGLPNRGALRLNSLSFGSSSNSNVLVRLAIGSTFNGTPVFTPISGSTANNGVTITNGNSISSVDVAGTTVTARGIYIFNMSSGSNATNIIDLEPFELFVNPSETLTISGQSSANTNATCSINFSEDI